VSNIFPEIAAIIVWDLDLVLNGFHNDESAEETLLGNKIKAARDLDQISYDWIIITSLVS